MKSEIGDIAVSIAGKVIEKEVKEADHQKLIDEFISDVGEASWQKPESYMEIVCMS